MHYPVGVAAQRVEQGGVTMKNYHTAQRGFSLIELMIVIAIVGILAAIALPAYQDYTLRAKMAEPLAKLSEAKVAVAEFYTSRALVPASLAAAGVNGGVGTAIYREVTYTTVGGAPVLTAWVRAAILPVGGDLAFSLSGVTQGDNSIRWICKPGDASGASAMNPSWLPSNCRG